MSNPTLDIPEKPLILLAEDDPDQSDMLRESLENHGYAVDTAFSGDIAYKRLHEKHYAAAILDGRMPGLHGGTVLKTCKALGRLPATPVIMVSAFAAPADMERYRRDGAVGTFSKPLNVSKLLQLLAAVVAPAAL